MCAEVVQLEGVGKRFGSRSAVTGLDLSVPRGSCFGLLGPNGAGKTTTIRMIYGATDPSEGRVRVFGMDVAHEPRAVRTRLGVTLQENVLIGELTPAENLRIFAGYHLIREPERSQRIEELLDFLDLRSHAELPVAALSGGFQRRLSIAQSLINRPELLILDEPTTGLDPAVRLALWSRIRELRARGTTVLITTHYMDEAERLCDRVAIMSEGRVVCEGSPADLIRSHLAQEAVEVHCDADEEGRILHGFAPAAKRFRAGDRTIVYVEDAGAVIEWVRQHDGGERRAILARPANLEDVFLVVTGTRLDPSP